MCTAEGCTVVDEGATSQLKRSDCGSAATGPASGSPAAIRDHVLLGCAGSVLDADERLAGRVDRAMLEAAVGAVPDAWLDGSDRADYVTFFETRLRAPRDFATEAEDARDG